MTPSKKTIILVYAIFLVIIMWQSANRQTPPPPKPVRLAVASASVTLPVTPVLQLVNTSTNPVTIDTCRDIQVVANKLPPPTNLPPSFCRTVTIEAGLTKPLFGDTKQDILTFQERFAEVPNTLLTFSYIGSNIQDLDPVDVTINHAGWFRLFFRHVFYNPVYNLFAALILIFPGYSLGWAIIAITLIIRLILLIPQQKMLVSQRRMQAIQPKIKSIQEEHKGDQATIGVKMMDLYKKEGVNPLGSCLPLVIQIPILIVLYQVILNIVNPSNLAHLYSFPWLQSFRDVTISTNFYGISLDKSGGYIGIGLALVTGGLQFWQMWLAQQKTKGQMPKVKDVEKAEKPSDAMPDMQQMQKYMVYVFPVMAALFAFQFPAGVAVYWLVGTIFMIVQQAVANKQAEEKKMVIRDKAGKVVG